MNLCYIITSLKFKYNFILLEEYMSFNMNGQKNNKPGKMINIYGRQ